MAKSVVHRHVLATRTLKSDQSYTLQKHNTKTDKVDYTPIQGNTMQTHPALRERKNRRRRGQVGEKENESRQFVAEFPTDNVSLRFTISLFSVCSIRACTMPRLCVGCVLLARRRHQRREAANHGVVSSGVRAWPSACPGAERSCQPSRGPPSPRSRSRSPTGLPRRPSSRAV